MRSGGNLTEMSQALIDATKEWLEHVMPNPWPFKREQVLRVPTNSVTLAGLEAAFVWEATDRNRAILFLNIFGFHAKLNMGINQVSLTLVL